MSRPRLLDLFCGAGGAAMGYHRAGFEVVGVDIKPQPHYPFEFHQGDVMEIPWTDLHWRYDAIHASPPCQAFSQLRRMPTNREPRPDLVTPTRLLIKGFGVPWVIENVPGAPLINTTMLCGTMFALHWGDAELRRHRLFESDADIFGMLPPHAHGWCSGTIGVYGGGGVDRRFGTSPQQYGVYERSVAMGIDWMTSSELSQAIPPAYTQWIGTHLLAAIRAKISASPARPQER